MKTSQYTIVTTSKKLPTQEMEHTFTVTTPTGEIRVFDYYGDAFQFVEWDKTPTPKPIVERIKTKLTPELKMKILDAKRRKQEEYETEQLVRFTQEKERAENKKRIESREFWDSVKLAAILVFLAILITPIFLI